MHLVGKKSSVPCLEQLTSAAMAELSRSAAPCVSTFKPTEQEIPFLSPPPINTPETPYIFAGQCFRKLGVFLCPRHKGILYALLEALLSLLLLLLLLLSWLSEALRH